jgi:hypothetical protein
VEPMGRRRQHVPCCSYSGHSDDEYGVEPRAYVSRSIQWGSVAALVCAMYSHATSIAFL